MKKRYMIPLVGAVATAGVTYLMKKRMDEESFTGAGSVNESFAQAGMPDQLDKSDHAQLENAKMVSEGSQFGVQYFNEVTDDEVEEIAEKYTN